MARLIGTLVTALLLTACSNGEADISSTPPDTETYMTEANIAQLIETHSEQLMQLDDVVGIGEGICAGTPCIRIFLARENTATLALIPAELDGVPVEIEVSGMFRANPD